VTEYNECSNFLLIRNDRDKQRPSARNALRLCDSRLRAHRVHLNREDAKRAGLEFSGGAQAWPWTPACAGVTAEF
jgi:hypothetical protein